MLFNKQAGVKHNNILILHFIIVRCVSYQLCQSVLSVRMLSLNFSHNSLIFPAMKLKSPKSPLGGVVRVAG